MFIGSHVIELGAVVVVALTETALAQSETLYRDESNTTGRYHLSDKPVEAGARNVIIDEAPMLTEEMLAALIQVLLF